MGYDALGQGRRGQVVGTERWRERAPLTLAPPGDFWGLQLHHRLYYNRNKSAVRQL